MKDPIRRLDGPSDQNSLKPVRLVVAALILRHVDNRQVDNRHANNLPADGIAQDGIPANGADGHANLEVLICQRKPDQPMSLKWEFPGGKIESGETAEEALARELQEELGISATIGRKVARIRHKYRNGGAIDLQFFLVNEFTGALENRIFNDVRWSPLAALPEYDFLAADLGLIRDLSEGKLL